MIITIIMIILAFECGMIWGELISGKNKRNSYKR